MKNFPPHQEKIVKFLIANYFMEVEKALKSVDWRGAEKALNGIKGYQKVYGKDVIPSDKRVEMEIQYNKLNIFNSIVPIYLLAGLILLVLAFINIVKPKFSLNKPVKITLTVLIITFALHTFGLGSEMVCCSTALGACL